MFHVVSYDISDDKRRTAVAKTLLDYGSRVQYSTFECILDDELPEEMIKRLSRIISDEDSVRIYVMCAKCERVITILGHGEVSEDEKVFII
jgi:CRISPR-associated protein Cas2